MTRAGWQAEAGYHKARLRAFIDRVLTAGEIDAPGEYFHGDVLEKVLWPGQGLGLHGLSETLTRLRRAFPDMHWCVEEQMAEDTRICVSAAFAGRARIRASSSGFPNAPRGPGLGMVIDRFEGDKVRFTRILMDTPSLLQQPGMVTTAPEAGADPNAAR